MAYRDAVKESAGERRSLDRRLSAAMRKRKQWHGIAIRYDKTAAIYLAGLRVAAVFIRSAR